MAITRPSDSAPVNRRGGRGRGRGSGGPRASLKDEEGRIIPQLAHYAGGRGAKEQEESAEPKLFPDIPPERYPPRPHTQSIDPASCEDHVRSHIYPKPTEKQLFMRNAMTSQLSFYRNSDYYILLEDLTADGGAVFEGKKANKVTPGMNPGYYPEEITKKEEGKKKRKASSAAVVGVQEQRRPQSAAIHEDPGAVLDRFARREALSAPQDLELEDEIEELDEEADALDEAWESDPYENYDDDEGYDEDDNDGNENIY